MSLNFRQFREVGSEQWLALTNPIHRSFVRLFGPLGVHARIRNARVINAIRRLNLPQNARLLDAGCGHAYATFWLARHYPAYQLTALEVDEGLVQNGRQIVNKLGLINVQFVQDNALNINQNTAYDLVFSIDVLEHIDNDVGTLLIFRNALKPGGRLLLHLPRRHQEHKRFFPVFKNHTTPDHVRDEYTADEIEAKLTQAGLCVDYLRYGFSMWGELAFELNYLFWDSRLLRTFSAILFHPISVWAGYMDTRQDYNDGNSLLVLAHPTDSFGANA